MHCSADFSGLPQFSQEPHFSLLTSDEFSEFNEFGVPLSDILQPQISFKSGLGEMLVSVDLL